MSGNRKPWKIVKKIEEGIDPREVLCTTYQMRNFYRQFGDGFISSLDVMNYIQHYVAARMARKNDVVLDVCCGRCLMLPLFRWLRPEISKYVGVDISSSNQSEAMRWSASTRVDGKRLAPNWFGGGEPYYPFEVYLVESNVAEMSEPLYGHPDLTRGIEDTSIGLFDFVIYTASIEHMQREAGVQSLRECWEVMKPGSTMFLSSPNTTEKGEDPYKTQYAAHLYEWPREELLEVCREVGFKVVKEVGLVAKVRGYEENLKRIYGKDDWRVSMFKELGEYLPSVWLYSIVPIVTPEIADEVAFVLRKPFVR